MMKPGRNPSFTCPSLLASSTRAVSMYWRYVALLTWPITSISRNWTGSTMLNFTCDQRADRIRPNHRENRQPISTSTHVPEVDLPSHNFGQSFYPKKKYFGPALENKFKHPVHHFQIQVSNIQKSAMFYGELLGRLGFAQSLRNGGNGRMAEGGDQNNRCPVSQKVPSPWLSSETCRSQPHSVPSIKPRSRRRAVSQLSSSQEDSDTLRRA